LLPSTARSRLHGLFREVEKEFEALYVENARLRDRVQRLEKGGDTSANVVAIVPADEKEKDEPDAFEAMLRSFTKKNALKTQRRKFKAHTSKIVSSFKAPAQMASLVREYRGHRDGIWDVAVSHLGRPLLATASADKTVRVWGVDSARVLASYVGHSGSVNAVSFHPGQDLLALSASGDGTAHVWKIATLPDALAGGSSEESAAESSEEDGRGANSGAVSGGADGGGVGGGVGGAVGVPRVNVIRQPIVTLSGHQGVVIGAAWLDEELAVTASWDRSANLFNVETGGTLLQTLVGHDAELTHVACHPTMRLVATSSQDTTFRLWDFRETIHSVSVFQGHTDSVTCTAFSSEQKIVSGSDDRTVRVWDLRNMRAPVVNIHTASAVNRLAVSQSGAVAIPHDNRQVALYDLSSGQKLLRLPRDSHKKSHHRMVTAVCWAPSSCEFNGESMSASASASAWRCNANLFSVGFDRVAFGWWVRSANNEGATGASVANVPGGSSVGAGSSRDGRSGKDSTL